MQQRRKGRVKSRRGEGAEKKKGTREEEGDTWRE